MKINMLKALASAAAGALLAGQSNAIVLDISSIGDSGILFNGDSTLELFSNTDGFVFEVNGSSGGAGDSQGLFGAISGTWTIDPWTGSTTTLSGGPGSLSIWDMDGLQFMADLDFEKIGTVLSGGVINGLSNLSNFSYAGTNTDLGLLYVAGSATLAMSFEIASGPPGLTLGYLANNTVESTFSGDIASVAVGVPDGGETAAMLGLGLLSLAGLARFRRSA